MSCEHTFITKRKNITQNFSIFLNNILQLKKNYKIIKNFLILDNKKKAYSLLIGYIIYFVK